MKKRLSKKGSIMYFFLNDIISIASHIEDFTCGYFHF